MCASRDNPVEKEKHDIGSRGGGIAGAVAGRWDRVKCSSGRVGLDRRR